MVNGDWRKLLIELAGESPAALLHARPVEDAEEVLICSYTADLRFFESVSLADARAMRARVTVVHDAQVSMTPADECKHAGTAYTDVPVRCRSGGAFHPKLVVIASPSRAVVAVGSGNLTSAGWHHNAELWTVIAGATRDWPQTFVDLAAWLRRLPEVIEVDPFGADRIRDVAELLAGHKATEAGPRLVHNVDKPLMHALPDLRRRGATEVNIASPFLDSRCSALDALTRRLASRRA